MNSPETLLRDKKLRVTQVRLDALKAFMDAGFAISIFDLMDRLENNYDEATLYRTINSFSDKDIIHTVPADGKTAYYALNNGNTNVTTADIPAHAHLKCRDCGHTYCLKNIKFGDIETEGNFKAEFIDIVIYGSCEVCCTKSEEK